MKNTFSFVAIAIAAVTIYACGSSSSTAKSTEEKQAVSTTAATAQPEPTEKSIVVDVRSQQEWDNEGHAPCSILIPLNELQNRVEELKAYDKVTFVCRSGARAGRAAQFLKGQAFSQVENAGPWQNAPCN